MAAIAIPLIAALAPTIGTEIIQLIAGLVHKAAPIAEITHGPSTGPVKFVDVYLGVMDSLVRAHAAGTIAILPDGPTVKIIIQAVVSSMNLAGLLDGSTSGVVDTSPIQKWDEACRYVHEQLDKSRVQHPGRA